MKYVNLSYYTSAKHDDQAKAVPGPTQTKDDAYDKFMREMEGLI